MTNELHQMVGRIDERTELMMRSMDEFKRSSQAHGERISSLEHDRSRVKGGLYVVGIVSGGVGALLSKIVGVFT